jgi:serine phosphatase RsbU (regulator of sigma subunit)
MARSQRTGRNRYEFFLPRKDGSHVPVIISARRLRDSRGQGFAVGTLIDITDQKRVEGELKTAYAELRKRTKAMEAELELASRVQHSLVPKSIAWGKIVVESFYRPARTIGGDFGVATALPDGQLRLLVCDVTGHGISSALIANRIYTETMALFARDLDVSDILRQLNAFVVHLIQEPGFYFTMALGSVDQDGSHVRLASGGHPPALWVTPTGASKLAVLCSACWTRPCRPTLRRTCRCHAGIAWCSTPTDCQRCGITVARSWVWKVSRRFCASTPRYPWRN